MNIRIAEPDGFPPEALALLRTLATVDVTPLTQGGLSQALATCDVLWLRLGLRVRMSDVPPTSRCRWIVTATTGEDHIEPAALKALGATLLSLKGRREFLDTITSTAEHTLGLLLAVARNTVPAVESVRGGTWNRDLFKGTELAGRTALIVGYGRLGRMMAGYLLALRLRVVAFDPHVVEMDPGVERMTDWHQALGMADVVTVHVGLTAATTGLFDGKAFSAMKRGSWFINTSRGQIVDDAALVMAMESGIVAGAGLDVVSGEPDVDAHHPLVQYSRRNPNLIITPHIGGATHGAMARCEAHMARVLVDSIEGGARGH